MTTSESTTYLTTLHKNIDAYFNFDEVKELCFDLGIDHEHILGNQRSAFIRNLIVSLARQNRLQELIDILKNERDFVEWQDVPANFELPTAVAQEDIRQVNNYTIYGDVTQGDKVGGDKVEGDKITVGNITGSQGIAIGRDAKAEVHIQQGMSGAELNQLFAPLLQQVAQQAPTEQKAEAVAKVNQLKEETAKGADANDEAVAGFVQDIADIAPSTVEAITTLFANAVIAKSAGAATKFVLGRLSR